MARLTCVVELALAVVLAMGSAWAGEVRPLGPEFQISRGHTVGYAFQDARTRDVAVSRAPSGDFVVVWEEVAGRYINGDTEYNFRVAARRMHRDGTGAGDQFTVFQKPDNGSDTFKPSIAATPDDGFIVVWGNEDDDFPNSPFFGRIWAQRYDDSSTPVGPKIQVNTAEALTNDRNATGVAAAPDNGFLVVWDSWDAGFHINARRFDAANNPQGAEFRVETDPVHNAPYPTVDSNADGDFVVVWRDYWLFDNTQNGIFGQRLDADANFVGSEFRVSEYGDVFRNRAAIAPDGTVMVLGWPYGPDHDLTGRIYDPAGTPVTGEFDINFDADMFGIDADPDGNFVVVWRTYPYYNVKGQRFSPSGVALDPVFTVSEKPQYGNGYDAFGDFPDVATDASGDFVVVWNNNYYGYIEGQYQYYMGAFGRRMAVCGNGRVGPDDACDDGNTIPLDGCSATCQVETCHACSGDPSLCPPLAGCAAVCTDPAPIQPNTAILTFKGIGAPTGDEGFTFKGKIADAPVQHLEYDPSVEGLEVAFTSGAAVYVLAGAGGIPPGGIGTGCDPLKDGWKAKPGSYVYKNASGALPPACTPGSANGVRVVKIKDKIDRDGTLLFRVKARGATIALAPTAPLVATVVLGQSPAAGASGRCGQITFTGAIGSRFFP